MDNIVKYVLLFFFYSFAGWCLESTYCSLGKNKFINRGFLTGPLCPIYGTAAIVMTVLIYNPFKDNALVVFLLGIVLCDIVEYLTSYIMEKLFAARWWDYTYELLNIKGRICLKHSLFWGMISIVFVKVIHPIVDALYVKIGGKHMLYVLIVILIIFVLDLINAVRKAMDIRKLQMKINKLINTLGNELSSIREIIGDKYAVLQDRLEKQSDKVLDFKDQIEDTYSQFEKMITKRTKKERKELSKQEKLLSSRIFRNYPELEKATRKRMDKLRDIVDDIKANVYNEDEMQ